MKIIAALVILLMMLSAADCGKGAPKPKPSPSCYTTDQGVRECGLQSGVQPAPSK